MKTLDEVIKELKTIYDRYEAEGCFYCSFQRECASGYCYLADALHYLKELRDMTDIPMEYFESGGTSQKLRNTSQITCPKCHSEFVILPEANNPLTWEELKQMEGKPVWVEWTKTEESYWCFVGEWFDDDEMRIYHIGRDYADYIHKTVYEPDIVQAYRKERS